MISGYTTLRMCWIRLPWIWAFQIGHLIPRPGLSGTNYPTQIARHSAKRVRRRLQITSIQYYCNTINAPVAFASPRCLFPQYVFDHRLAPLFAIYLAPHEESGRPH